MSVFEPDAVWAQCVNFFSDPSKRRAVDAAWKAGVEKHVLSWKEKRKNQSKHEGQLEFVAEVVEYVDLLTTLTRATSRGAAPRELNARFPLHGPHFIPPSFSHAQRRHAVTQVKPKVAYLKPVTVIHPAFYPDIGVCPHCGSKDIYWYGWSPTGYREVHGIEREETAIGYQLRCNPCKELYGKGGSKTEDDESYSCLTTNCQFWQNREHWDIPIGIPHFMKKCALTRDLFDLIVEFRPSGTAAGIAEHIHQLHLFEYHRRRLEYLRAYAARVRQTAIQPPPALQNFAEPLITGNHDAGYDCRSISDDLVGDVYNSWVQMTRQPESEATLRTLGAVTISLDATFRSVGKATVADKDKARTKLWTGGLQSVVNEKNLIIAWRLCLTLANLEVQELLEGVSRRLQLLDYADPEIAVADNCCHVRTAIRKVFPNIDVVLDVWHFIMRYAICVVGGVKSPYRAAVARDITNAILKSTASNGNPAVYRSQEEQERRLVEAYERWAEKGDVWSKAAEKVHEDQLAHVKKGCLARRRNDVRTDGSRIEGSHGKGWNGIQRSHASGVESFTYLGHDFVLRRNTRIDFRSGSASAFVTSTHGSHHVNLVNAVASLWNQMLDAKRKVHALPADLSPYPILEPAPSGETFGLMKMSAATAAHYTLVKEEPTDTLLDLASHDDPASVLGDMGIDPSLVHLLASPVERPSAAFDDSTPRASSSAVAPAPSTILSSSPTPKPLQQTVSGVIEITDSCSNSDADTDHFPGDVAGVLRLIDPPLSPQKRRADDTDAARQSTSDLLAPPVKKARLHVSGSNTTSKGKGKASNKSSAGFFAPRGHASSTLAPASAYTPLCLPNLNITGLTRSQQFVSVACGLDLRSLKITHAEKDAFFLFMDLRKQHQWVSFNMTPRAWVLAASAYNTAAEMKNATHGRSLVRKTPRALLEKLGDIEVNIMGRIKRGDYKSRSGGTKFWHEHCHAVPLRIMKPGEVATGDQNEAISPRKVHTCMRCKTIMYPGSEGSTFNHKRGVCSDGVFSVTRNVDRTVNGETVKVREDPPQWPQPAGIFTKGKYFHGAKFLAAVEEMYDRLVVKRDIVTERTMEYIALASMFRDRLLFAEGIQEHAPRALFTLFESLELRDCPKEIVVKHHGADHIHVNYLCQQAAGVPLVIGGGADAPAAGGGSASA